MADKIAAKILLVDDDTALLSLMRSFFEERGYEIYCAENAFYAQKLLSTARFDCVILDVGLPDGNGFDICTQIREFTTLPILFLSCYTKEESRIRGLSIGGDDYICKPFSLPELEARVRLRIRDRHDSYPSQLLQYDSLTINTGTRQVSYDGRTEEFTRIEFDILSFLAGHPNRVFSYEQLYDAIWKEPINLGRHALQARMAEVRQKLFNLCPEKEYIRTIRNKGYLFVP